MRTFFLYFFLLGTKSLVYYVCVFFFLNLGMYGIDYVVESVDCIVCLCWIRTKMCFCLLVYVIVWGSRIKFLICTIEPGLLPKSMHESSDHGLDYRASTFLHRPIFRIAPLRVAKMTTYRVPWH
jgi:hypothetical protein